MISVLLLWLLATLDAAMSGYRAAGGRSAKINKRSLHIRAQLLGVACGQCCLVLLAGLVVLLLLTADRVGKLSDDLVIACESLHVVFIPYSLVFLAALVLRLLPSVDVRSVLNVLVFGPFTLLRPFVGIGGVLLAFAAVPRWQVLCVGLAGIAMMTALEPFLNRWFAGMQGLSGPLTGQLSPASGVPEGET